MDFRDLCERFPIHISSLLSGVDTAESEPLEVGPPVSEVGWKAPATVTVRHSPSVRLGPCRITCTRNSVTLRKPKLFLDGKGISTRNHNVFANDWIEEQTFQDSGNLDYPLPLPSLPFSYILAPVPTTRYHYDLQNHQESPKSDRLTSLPKYFGRGSSGPSFLFLKSEHIKQCIYLCFYETDRQQSRPAKRILIRIAQKKEQTKNSE